MDRYLEILGKRKVKYSRKIRKTTTCSYKLECYGKIRCKEKKSSKAEES